MLWATFTLTGMRISLLLKKRLNLLEETLTFLNTMIVSIEYTRSDILKIISSVIKEDSLKNLVFLRKCYDGIRNGYDFPDSWSKAVESTHLYKSDERAKLLQLGTCLGTSDSKNQVNIISSFRYYFEGYLSRANDDYTKYGKVSSLFGMFLGAVVFILLY